MRLQISEKESGVRQVMSTMGLLDSPFWITWIMFEGSTPATLVACLPCEQSTLLKTAVYGCLHKHVGNFDLHECMHARQVTSAWLLCLDLPPPWTTDFQL